MPFDNNRDEYLHVWRVSLKVLLGWSETDVAGWASRYEQFLVPEDDSDFYHEAPVHYLVGTLVPSRLLRSLKSHERLSLLARLQQAIEDGDSFWDRNPDYDWNAAKTRINDVLKEHGESLESVRKR